MRGVRVWAVQNGTQRGGTWVLPNERFSQQQSNEQATQRPREPPCCDLKSEPSEPRAVGVQLPRGGGGMSGFSGSAPWGWARCCSAPQARNFAGKGTSCAEITREENGRLAQEDIGKKIRDVTPVFSARGSSACGAGKNPHGGKTPPLVGLQTPLWQRTDPLVAAEGRCHGHVTVYLCKISDISLIVFGLMVWPCIVHVGRCEPRTPGFESRKNM